MRSTARHPGAKCSSISSFRTSGACRTTAPSRHGRRAASPRTTPSIPRSRFAHVDDLVALRALDVVDLSTGILDDSVYRTWGTDALHAQDAAWREVARRHWRRDVVLNARKALAHPGTYQGTPASADASTTLFVDTPLHQGARAVDVWTWRQPYEGSVYRLADPGLQGNALWSNLVAARAHGDLLFTHFSPSSVEDGVPADLDMISQAFGGVFVATGTG